MSPENKTRILCMRDENDVGPGHSQQLECVGTWGPDPCCGLPKMLTLFDVLDERRPAFH